MELGFLGLVFYGARLWIWLLLLISFLMFIGVIAYLKREKIKKKYFMFRYPEKLIKCIVHYKSGMFKIYWRIIPSDDKFYFDNQIYKYSDKKVLKNNDWYVRQQNTSKSIVKLGDKEFYLEDKAKLNDKEAKFPEIHYYFNNPCPIEFTTKGMDFSADDLKNFEEHDLWTKLLTLEGEKSFLLIILFLVIGNMLLTMFIIAKMMGWIK